MKENAKCIPTDESCPYVLYSITTDLWYPIRYPKWESRIGEYPTLADAQAAGERLKDDYDNFVIVQVRAVSIKPTFWKEYK